LWFGFFWGLGGEPRGGWEEGGTIGFSEWVLGSRLLVNEVGVCALSLQFMSNRGR
jgi:hypothetical protein